MGQKIHPIGFRLGVQRIWTAKWYGSNRNFASTLLEDIKVRDYLKKKLAHVGYIKDTTNTYDYALLLVAAALLCGGALGLYLGPLTAREKQIETPALLPRDPGAAERSRHPVDQLDRAPLRVLDPD